jgi:MYXO-CTERM domain-containing protein
MKLRAAWLALSLSALSAPAFAFPVTVLQQAGPVTERFNVAILGDGYRASDQAKLTSDAKALVDAVFDAVPYKPYRQLFNFKVIQSVSVDQGAKGGSAGGTPNTLFSAYFDCQGVAQLVCLDDAAVLTAAATDVPEVNLAVVVVNDAKYGGAGGNVPCVSTAPESAEILRHELGHNLANLADEYTSPYPGYPACSVANDCSEPNVTLRNARAQIKWLDWIADSTPVPTTAGENFAGVGLFQGARYMTTGFYRPVDTACKMQSLGQPFCPVCAEALVRSFWNLSNVHLIDEAVPAADVKSTSCVAQTFTVKTPTIAPSSLSFSWTIDGHAELNSAASLVIAASAVSEGPHTVVVTVKDTTALVRDDPKGVLLETHTFNYEAPACQMDASAPTDSGSGGTAAPDAGMIVPDASAPDSGVAGAPSSAMGGAPGAGGSVSSGGNPPKPTPSSDPPNADDKLGCSCRMTRPRHATPPLVLVSLFALAAVLRRRRDALAAH